MELREHLGRRTRSSHTWSFLPPVDFILPVRVKSALKEISEIPGSKRRGIVRVQGGSTQSGPRWTILSPGDLSAQRLLSHWFRGDTGSKTPPCLPRRSLAAILTAEPGLLTTHILLSWRTCHSCVANQTLHVWPSPGVSERVPGHPNGCMVRSPCKDTLPGSQRPLVPTPAPVTGVGDTVVIPTPPGSSFCVP